MVIEECNDLRNGRPKGHSKLHYNLYQQRSEQKIGYSTVLREFRQYIGTCCTAVPIAGIMNISVAVFEESDDLRNGCPNGFSKLNYDVHQPHSHHKIEYCTMLQEF